MHLADIDGVVAAVAERFDPVGLVGGQLGFVAVDAVGVDVLARDDAIARRPADRAPGEGAAEGYAAGGEAVDMRGAHVVVAQSAEGVPALLVGDDEDDIGVFSSRLSLVNVDGLPRHRYGATPLIKYL